MARSSGTRLTRRSWLAAVSAGALALSLGGCGFELRRPAELPYHRIALVGFAKGSPMAEALRRELPPGTEVVEAPKDAEVVLQALDDHLQRIVAASTSAGQVREFRLRVSLRFRLTRPDGISLLADTELEQSRDMSYTETAALAKQNEEAVLLRDMRGDLAQQVMRMMVAASRLPAAVPAASAAASASSSAR